MNCTGRSATRCDFTRRLLPTLREFPIQERKALQLEDRIPVIGDDSECGGYGRSKAADVTEGFGIDIYTLIFSRDMAESSKMA